MSRQLKLSTILLLSALSLLTFGQTAAEEPLLLRFSYWGNHEEHQFFTTVCREFEKENPGIRIKQEWYIGDYGRKLQLVLITGEAADIILMDDEIYPSYDVRGYLEDLRPYINRRSDELEQGLADELAYMETPKDQRDPSFQREYLPTALQSFNYRGRQGGLPWDGNPTLVFYNQDLFDRAGIPYPPDDWTWNDFRRIAKQLTIDEDGDGRPEQFGTNYGFGFLGFEPLLWSFGGAVLNEDHTRCRLQEPRAIEAAEFIYEMKMKDHSIAWSGEMEGFNTEVQLLTGRVGMVTAASYMIPQLNRVKEGGMRWGLAHMPFGPYGDRWTRVTWDGISLNAGTTPEKKEAAWLFIKNFINDRNMARIGTAQRGVPIRRSMVLKYYVKPETPVREETVLEAMDYGRLTPITPRYLELRDAMDTEFAELNVAEVTPEDQRLTPAEALARLEPKVNAVLDKEMADWAAQETGVRKKEGSSPWNALLIALCIVGAAFGAAMLFKPSRAGFLRQLEDARMIFRSKQARLEALEGILFASPWLMGLLLFTAFPIIFSIVLSFCRWDPYEPISTMRCIGLDNFTRALSTDKVTGDPLVLKALYNSFFYAVFAVPLGLMTSLGLAILLNQKIRGITIFRTTFYLPSIVSGVATVLLWMFIFNPVFGPLNAFLHSLNQLLDKTVVLSFITLPEPMWLQSPQWAKPAMILMSLWGAGGAGMLIFLAGLQGVPDQLYEVAELDGAGRFGKFWNITLPMLTPTIYFNLIMGIIGALKIFMQAFIMTDGKGGVDKSLLFYVLHLYNKAFVEFDMGYASALAWILFVVILALTLMVIRSSAIWVYYEGEKKR